jgi:phosphatidylinositol-bisphosphatase
VCVCVCVWCRRQADFTKTVEAKVFCGTWNVNGKTIKSEEDDLADWLCPADSSPSSSEYTGDKGEPLADIYFVGFQEMVDLTVVNVAVESKSQQRGHFWEETIAEVLARNGHYTQVMSKYLVGLLMCVFVKDSLLGSVKDVRATVAGVGVMGMMGNKGGVSCRLTLHDSSICVVCSHLAAHRENVAGRNADFQNILEKSIFAPLPENLTTAQEQEPSVDVSRNLNYCTGLLPSDELTILQHDLVFWLGDLNYRIDESLSMEEVFAKIEEKDWAYLREYDQLNIERFGMNVFEGFMEGELNFAPTYKYQPGTNEYDQRPDKKVRCPAWCDRVLWRSKTSLDSIDQVGSHSNSVCFHMHSLYSI